MSDGSGTKVLILGSTGLLGSTLQPFLVTHGYKVKTHGRSIRAEYQADLSNLKIVNEFLNEVQPEIIINLVGLTDVDQCERDPNKAYLGNVLTIENITAWINKTKCLCHLVQISTDQVYDGSGLHSEGRVTLTNYYAFSKYAGEIVASSVPSTILRTNFFGRSHCDNRISLTDWIYQSVLSRKVIQVFDDVLFNPISMASLSEVIEKIIQKKPIGLFNLGSHGGMSKADFAFTFAEELDLPVSLMTRTSTDQVTFLNTYRPKDMRMDCSKIETALEIKLPTLNEEISRVAREYHAEV